MFKRKIIPVALAAAVFFAAPGTQKAYACPDANQLLTHCAQFQVILGIVNFITANLHKPPGASTAVGNPTVSALDVLGQTTLFNIFYFSAVMAAMTNQPRQNLGPVPTSGGSEENVVGGTPGGFLSEPLLCSASGDCGAGPLSQLYGGGPNSGYLCDGGSGACGGGLDAFRPNIGGDFGNCSGNSCEGPEVKFPQPGFSGFGTTGSNPALLENQLRNNLTSGAIDPFGGATVDSYLDPRTGETITFDFANPPPAVIKAQKLLTAYVAGEINYPFYDDNWETRPISDFDPQRGNRGGVPGTLGSDNTQFDTYLAAVLANIAPVLPLPGAAGGVTTPDGLASANSGGATTPSTPAPAGSAPTFINNRPAIIVAPEVTTTPDGLASANSGGTTTPSTPAPAGSAPTFINNRPAIIVAPTSANTQKADSIRQKSRLVDTKTMYFSGYTHNVEIVESADGKLIALGTGDNAGHVFGEVRKGANRFSGYRREGPWTAPPSAPPSTGAQTSGVSQTPSGSQAPADSNCTNCVIQISPVQFQSGQYHFAISSGIAQSDQQDMSGAFQDGFESGNDIQWKVIVSN